MLNSNFGHNWVWLFYHLFWLHFNYSFISYPISTQ